jgi:hypothetical protein
LFTLVNGFRASRQTFRSAHGKAAHPVVPQVLLDFHDQVLSVHLNVDGRVDARKPVSRELHIHNRTDDLYYVSNCSQCHDVLTSTGFRFKNFD